MSAFSGSRRTVERAVTDLPEPDFADERQGLAGVEVEADAVDGLGGLAALDEGEQVADREHRVGQRELAAVLHAVPRVAVRLGEHVAGIAVRVSRGVNRRTSIGERKEIAAFGRGPSLRP